MHVLNNFRPTNTQKRVIAMILSAPTPKVAANNIGMDQSMKASRNMLGQLGLITFTAGSATVTDTGLALARDEGIADEGGQLTDAGQQLVGGDNQGQANSMGQLGDEPPIGGVPADASGDQPPMESFSMLRELMRS